MKVLFTLFSYVLFSNVALSQWIQTSGPEGVTVVSSEVCPSGAVLSDNSGNYYKLSGTNWVKTGSLPSSGLLQNVGDVIYVTKDQKLQRSSNFGTTWTKLPINGKITRSGNVLYCAMNDTLFASIDAGLTWQQNDTLPMFTEYVVSNGSHIVAVVNGFERKIIWTFAGSTVWHDAATPPPADGAFIVDVIAEGASLLALQSSGNIYSSSDGGDTWVKSYNTPSVTPEQYIQLLKNGDILWVRTTMGIYQWNDGLWSKRLDGYFTAMNSYVDGITLSNSQGVFRLPNNQDKVEYISTGFKNTSISNLTALGKTVFTTAHTGVFRSTNLGSSWQSVLPNVQPTDYASTGSHVFAFAGWQGVYRSADDGLTWESIPTPLDNQWQDGTSIATDGSSLFLVHGKTFAEHGTSRWVDGGVLHSTDNGATWNESSIGLPSTIESYVPTMQILNHNGTLYIATVAGFFRSPTGGTSWIPVNQGLEFQNAVKVGALIKGGNSLYCQYYGDMYILDGDLWIKLPKPDNVTNFFGAYSGYAMGVGDSLYAIAYSYDSFAAEFSYRTLLFDGTSWHDITSSLPEGVVLNNFTRTSGIMLAGSMGHSVWRMGTVNSAPNLTKVSETLLYPTPAESLLNLNTEYASANITITDVLGKEVLSLTNVSSNVPLNVSSLPPGVYTAIVRSSDATKSQKIIIK